MYRFIEISSYNIRRHALPARQSVSFRRMVKNRIADYRTFSPMVSSQILIVSFNNVMEIMGTHYSEKEAAGKAVINACTTLQGSDSVPLGQYRGFSMSLQYDAAHTDYKLTMKGAMSHTISLGADIFGNITRMDNLVDGVAKELERYRTALQDTHTQLANAKAEMETPFAKEAELAEKSARLKELNILLNMDQKDTACLLYTSDAADEL